MDIFELYALTFAFMMTFTFSLILFRIISALFGTAGDLLGVSAICIPIAAFGDVGRHFPDEYSPMWWGFVLLGYAGGTASLILALLGLWNIYTASKTKH